MSAEDGLIFHLFAVLFTVGGAAIAGGLTLFLTALLPCGSAGAEMAVGQRGIALRGR